MQLVILANI